MFSFIPSEFDQFLFLFKKNSTIKIFEIIEFNIKYNFLHKEILSNLIILQK